MLEYWGLKEKPFENTADPSFFYHSRQHEEGLARLHYVIDNKKGLAVLTGVFGCGKTVLAKTLLSGLQQRSYQIAYVNNPPLTGVELLRSIARNMSAENLPAKLSDMSSDYFLEVIESLLINNAKDGRDTLVFIDEAHVITNLDVFEQLRLFLNFQLDNRFLLTLILMGQPELRERIEKSKQLLQRVALSYHLEPLSEEETAAYIGHRLGVAGVTRQLFNPEAFKAVYRTSGGIPRRINQICDLSLLLGSAAKSEVITGQIVEEAVSSFSI